MIFIVIHMLIAALLHVVFSEDLAFLKKGHYLKFFHNVIMNAFASIYFHNYLRFDEMPASNKKDPEFIGKFNFWWFLYILLTYFCQVGNPQKKSSNPENCGQNSKSYEV